MPFTTGTATDSNSLLSNVISFLGSNGWSTLSDSTDTNLNERYVYLRGQGLAATDQIFVQIRTFQDIGNQIVSWDIRGATGYDGNLVFEEQPGVLERGNLTATSPRLTLINNNMRYWVIANARRFIVVAQVSTVYCAAYCGFILPYGIPSRIPYPLFVGGSASEADDNFSQGTYELGNFWDGHTGGSYFRNLNGWEPVGNFSSTGSNRARGIADRTNIWPYPQVSGSESTFIISPAPATTPELYAPYPLVVYNRDRSGQQNNVWGELDGVFYVTGQGPNVSEDTVSILGTQYLIVQNTYRTGIHDYAAIRLD